MKSIAVLCLLAACGQVEELKPGHEGKKADANADDATAQAPVIRREELALTAEHAARPLDILIIRESSGRLEQGVFGERLAQAAPTFAARVLFSGLDVRVGFLDAGVPALRNPNDPPYVGRAGGELSGTVGDSFVERANPAFRQLVEARLPSRNDRLPQAPLTALKLALERSQMPGTATAGFFREGAFLAVVFVQFSDETQEQLLPDDILEELEEHQGLGNFTVSVIAPDETGCDIQDDYRTNDEEYVRRNLLLRLQKKTGGLFTSLCDQTYAYFFDQILHRGTGIEHFPVILPEPAMWSSIEVDVGGAAVKDWRYTPRSATLLLPRLIPAGAAVTVRYEVDDGTRPNVAPEWLEELAVLSERKLSPDETLFNQDVNPVLVRNCNGGGCHGTGTSRNQYVDRFKTTQTNKMMILDYIQRPLGDPMHMPRNATMPSADYDTLFNWLNAQ